MQRFDGTPVATKWERRRDKMLQNAMRLVNDLDSETNLLDEKVIRAAVHDTWQRQYGADQRQACQRICIRLAPGVHRTIRRSVSDIVAWCPKARERSPSDLQHDEVMLSAIGLIRHDGRQAVVVQYCGAWHNIPGRYHDDWKLIGYLSDGKECSSKEFDRMVKRLLMTEDKAREIQAQQDRNNCDWGNQLLRIEQKAPEQWAEFCRITDRITNPDYSDLLC